MAIKIVVIGKKHESWVEDGIRRYQTRLKRPFGIEWVLLPHSAREGLVARDDESERLMMRLQSQDFVVLLDERGKLLDSPTLSHLLLGAIESSKTVVCVIGGAYGVNDSMRQRADIVWSLSPLVFPHQLVRLIVTEQLYRAQEIASGGPYHHE